MNSGKHVVIFAISFLLAFPAFVLSNTRIVDFHARRDNNRAILEWATEKELNLEKFVIQRSLDNVNWSTIGEVKSETGDSNTKRYYRFEDNNLFKNSISTFYYKLIIVDKSGQSKPYDVIVSLSGSSGIRHTWGSIKAMFR